MVGKLYTPITFNTPETYLEIGKSVEIELNPNVDCDWSFKNNFGGMGWSFDVATKKITINSDRRAGNF